MTRPVPEYEGVDRALFESVIVPSGRPAVLRQGVADWPMVQLGRTSTAALSDHLRAAATDAPTPIWSGAPEIEGRFSYADDLKSFNHVQENAPLATLLDRLAAHHDDAHPPGFYAGGVPFRPCLPGLLAETPMPLLDPATQRRTSLWIGNRVRTACHWDLPQNLACVVAGRRRFTLFPTDQIANLYIGPVDFTLSGQPTSLVDFHKPDFDRFPRFAEALQHAEIADLAPGDVLYMPSLWFHHVESLDPFGAMVNFWWRDAPPHMTAPIFTLLHGLMTLRDLNHRERQAWRVIFDHYLFRPDDEEPMAHIPPDARGLFAAMTPDIEQRLKATLMGPLSR
ncbi:cupin-like domain-containing protein [Brevundimonas sp. AJA228-03]|uniref:cupin-like domain-containing protein n=1 Tax=Brevundimonas sp. AJA228-03 TaxID=2752515 RepID=UPI001ADECE2B|nr:cupin-like domain-containing protein [Brevundimonas sp. AJA228-03]QTN20787.1 cupin-like domain-containing protein [Brevundimonas sp. AJA228-03]